MKQMRTWMAFALAALLIVAVMALLFLANRAPSDPQVVPEPTATPDATGTPEPTTPPVAAIDTSPVDPADWPPAIALEERWSGFELPVVLTHAGDGSGRVYVVEQNGRISIPGASPDYVADFLDVSRLVSTGGERGLLGLAFAPDYETSGVFYIDYTNTAGDTVIARYVAREGHADPSSAEIILTIKQPYANHNGGQIAFGPDGYLYIGMGDGGSGGDPEGNGQDPRSLLGKMLRIDVTGAVDSGEPYVIPADNPFVDDGTYRPEIWSLGLRNPWRFSFDRGTGELYIGDVGQSAWEEIDVEPPATGGRNYGWNVFEGTHTYPPGTPSPGNAGRYTKPVVEYDRSAGKSVTGGFVYRGTRYPSLRGVYVYADYVTGRVWGLARVGSEWKNETLLDSGLNPSSFGEDETGELYLLDHTSGTIYQVTGTR
ncbi:MAG: PQQ-dependent sugar dehydrogenase [Coriobacteriia bacterium]